MTSNALERLEPSTRARVVSVARLDGTSDVRAGLAAHRASLWAHARKLAKNVAEAEDLLQDTACRALAFANGFEAGTNVRAWLHQILHSVFVTRCRRRARERRCLDGLALDPCAWVRSECLQPAMTELSPRVERALQELPQAFQDVVRLVDVQQLSYRAAAELLAVPLGTVMSRLHRGRRLLASALADDFAGSIQEREAA